LNHCAFARAEGLPTVNDLFFVMPGFAKRGRLSTFDPACEVNLAGGIYVAFMTQDQQLVETDIPARLD
jgi:hypothetical protein